MFTSLMKCFMFGGCTLFLHQSILIVIIINSKRGSFLRQDEKSGKWGIIADKYKKCNDGCRIIGYDRMIDKTLADGNLVTLTVDIAAVLLVHCTDHDLKNNNVYLY